MRAGVCRFTLLTVALIAAVSSAQADDAAVLLSGKAINAQVKSIIDGTVTFAKDAEPTALIDLRKIERAVKPDRPSLRNRRVYLADGGVLVATRVRIDSEFVTVDIAEHKALRLPLGSVRGVVLVPVGVDARGRLRPEPVFNEALNAATDPSDALYVKQDDGRLTVVSGALEALGAEDAKFVWNERTRTVGRDKLYGVTLAVAGKKPDVTGKVKVALAGGSTLWADVRLEDGRLQLQRDDGVTLGVPWPRIVRMDVRSPKMAFCSDLTPKRIDRENVLLAPAWGPTFDAAVMSPTGEAISLGGKRYERGVGVRSGTAITYEINERYDRFVATIGFDDSLQRDRTNPARAPTGKAAFIVTGDGRELFRATLTEDDKPRTITVNVTGVEDLRLYLDPLGDDLGDAAAWADARFIRDRSSE